MDMGIIKNMKEYYRRNLIREKIAKLDDRQDFRPNLLQALYFLKAAWDVVKPETLRNCFKKAKFVRSEAEQVTLFKPGNIKRCVKRASS